MLYNTSVLYRHLMYMPTSIFYSLYSTENKCIFIPKQAFQLFSVHGSLSMSTFPPQTITPTFLRPGNFSPSCFEVAAAMEAPAEASTTIFIRSAANFMPRTMSSSETTITSGSIRSQRMGNVNWPAWKLESGVQSSLISIQFAKAVAVKNSLGPVGS